MKSLLLSLLFVCPLAAQTDRPAIAASFTPSHLAASALPPAYSLPREIPSRPPGRNLYAISVAALAAANAADLASSWGRREGNPFLASSQARFGPQSAALKAAFTGTSLAIQWVALRRNPRLYRHFASVNFTVSAGISAVAALNTRVAR